MTPEAINQAMAELDGWTACCTVGMHGYYRHTLDEHCRKNPRGGVSALLLPKYTKALNAVARVVGKLDDESLSGYRMLLRMFADSAIDATAMQRCEAILRAVGKWVDG